jgi:hypothetical protein
MEPPVVARYWVVLVSSMILPARRTLILNGVPGGAPANLLRIFSMLSSGTTGMPSVGHDCNAMPTSLPFTSGQEVDPG